MFCHVCFTRYNGQNLSVTSDNEGLPPIWERPQPFHPKLLRDGPIRIGCQRELQLINLVKFMLPVPRISAQSYHRGTNFFEFFS